MTQEKNKAFYVTDEKFTKTTVAPDNLEKSDLFYGLDEIVNNEMELKMLKQALINWKNSSKDLLADAQKGLHSEDAYTRGIASGMEIVLKGQLDILDNLIGDEEIKNVKK